MMNFAVWHEGIEEGQGRWVLWVDAEGAMFLLCDNEGAFYWLGAADCKLVRVATPDQPRLVLPVQPQQSSQITIPGLNSGRGLSV